MFAAVLGTKLFVLAVEHDLCGMVLNVTFANQRRQDPAVKHKQKALMLLLSGSSES